MKTIWVIAKRETMRLRSRFRGRSQPIAFLILIGALALSFSTFRQVSVVGEGMYRLGVSPGAPPVLDSRFSTVTLDRAAGDALLQSRALDAYLDNERVISRGDPKSRYATGALVRYLERQELARVSRQYDLDDAFPLRVEINTLTVAVESAASAPGPALSDLIGPWPPPASTVEPRPAPVRPETLSDAAVR